MTTTDESLTTGERPTVLSLLTESGNRRLLTEWLDNHERYVETDEGIDTATFDLCILDIESLRRESEALLRRKEETRDVLPYLLVVPDSGGTAVYRGLRKERPDLWNLVDGVLRVPIAEYELEGRVDTMLRLREQSTELTDLQESLRQRSEQFEILNRVLRHDIRNDMTVVLGWLEHLEDNVDDEMSPVVERIDTAAEHVVELTSVARDIAKATTSEESVELEEMSLTDVLRDVVISCQEKYDNAKINLPDTLPTVTIEANQLLSSVFRNLISNAVQHNDTDDPIVTVSMSKEDDRVIVQVADNGPGVPDDYKSQIFGDEVKGLDSSGTGMGLYLVSTLVDLYGGTVRVEDNEPRGAVFCVEFETVGPTRSDSDVRDGSLIG